MPDQVRVIITAEDRTKGGVQSAEKNIVGLSEQANASLQRIAAGAGIATAALGMLGSKALNAFAEMDRSLKSLDAVERGFMGTAGQLREAAKGLQDQFFGLGSNAQALQNLISSGLGVKEAVDLIGAFKDRAILLGNASIPLEQRLINLSQAFKTEQSELGDASGLTENFSQIVARGSQILGKNAEEMSKTERATAKYQAIMEMSAPFIGKAGELTDSLSGSQAALNTETTKLEQTIGQALAPAFQVLLKALTGMTSETRAHIEQNTAQVRGVALLTAGITAGTAVVTGLAVAFRSLTAAMATNPIGLVIAGVGALGGALAGLILQQKANEVEAAQNSRELVTLSQRYQQLNTVLDTGKLSAQERQTAEQEMHNLIQRIGELMPEIVSKWDAEGKAIELNTSKLEANTKALRDNLRLKMQDEAFAAAGEEAKARTGLDTFLANRAEARDQYLESLKFAQGNDFTHSREEKEAALQQALADWDKQHAAEEARLRRNAAVAQANTDRLSRMAAGPDERGRGSYTENPAGGINPPGGGGPPPGGKEMSAALQAAMEDLQDLQALDKTPENLRKTLEKVREILKTHGTELIKLEKDRDLIRLRDLTLPKELTQAEYTEAMRQLQTDEQMGQAKGAPLKPEVIKQRLQAIKEQFADYLKANPDAAASIEVRLAGLGSEEIKAKVQAALDRIDAQKKLFGKAYSAEQERADLGAILPIAYALPGSEGVKQVNDLIERMRTLGETIQSQRFDEKFKAIGKAREDAFAGAARQLADLEQQLADEEARGDKSDPQKIKRLKQQALDAVRPALEAQRDALQTLLNDETLTADQRAEVERELNGVKSELYQQDVDAHKLALDAKVAAERRLADQRKAVQTQALSELEKAERAALDAFKAQAKVKEDLVQGQIDAKERELQLYEREISAQERLKKIQEARQKVADLERNGQREQVLLASGAFETRIVGMDEARKALAEAEEEDKRAKHKEDLQDQIATLRDQLTNLKDSHQRQEDELRRHFADARDILETGFKNMQDAQTSQIESMAKQLGVDLGKLLGPWQTYAANVKALLSQIAAPPPNAGSANLPSTAPNPAVGSVTEAYNAALKAGKTAAQAADAAASKFGFTGMISGRNYLNGIPAHGDGGRFTIPHLAIVGDRPETIVTDAAIPRLAAAISQFMMPSLPALATGGGVSLTLGPGSIVVNVDGETAATPGAIGQEVAHGMEDGIMRAAQRGWIRGRIAR